jgi:hypothetical protein
MNRFPSVTLFAHGGLLALIFSISFSSCRRLDERMEIKETRPVSSYAPAVVPVVPSSDRFINAEPPAEPEQPGTLPANLFAWVTPEGWQEAPPDPTGIRYINLQFGSHGEGECSLSIMPGGAGGLQANVNRWRTQMGQPAYTPEELDKLPKKALLTREATYVTLNGDYKAVGATTPLKNYGLVGLVLPAPQFTVFVKMTGPKDLVDKNMDAFDQFVQSISPAR